jgi:aflatoxin B1 aldehyde reductase
MAGVKVIFGGATINTGRAFESKEEIETLFAALKKYDVKAIDTAQLYGESETLLGSVNAGSQFIIDTKWKGGFAAGSPTKENIVKDADESMEKLKMDKVSNPPTYHLRGAPLCRSTSSTSTRPTRACRCPRHSRA